MNYRNMRNSKNHKAFTIIELLVVILIIALLVAVAAPSLLGQQNKAHNSKTKQELTVVRKELKSIWVSDEKYPALGDINDNSSLLGQLKNSEPAYSFVADNASHTMATETDISISRENNNNVVACKKSKSNIYFCLMTNENNAISILAENNVSMVSQAQAQAQTETGQTRFSRGISESDARAALTENGSTGIANKGDSGSGIPSWNDKGDGAVAAGNTPVPVYNLQKTTSGGSTGQVASSSDNNVTRLTGLTKIVSSQTNPSLIGSLQNGKPDKVTVVPAYGYYSGNSNVAQLYVYPDGKIKLRKTMNPSTWTGASGSYLSLSNIVFNNNSAQNTSFAPYGVWSNYGSDVEGTYNNLSYSKDENSIVYLSGVLTNSSAFTINGSGSGTNNLIAKLPAGARPAQSIETLGFVEDSNGTLHTTEIYIDATTGDVSLFGKGFGDANGRIGTKVYLDGIKFLGSGASTLTWQPCSFGSIWNDLSPAHPFCNIAKSSKGIIYMRGMIKNNSTHALDSVITNSSFKPYAREIGFFNAFYAGSLGYTYSVYRVDHWDSDGGYKTNNIFMYNFVTTTTSAVGTWVHMTMFQTYSQTNSLTWQPLSYSSGWSDY